MDYTFEHDPKLARDAQTLADRAADFAKQHFGAELDFSEASVARVESILAEIHESAAAGRLSEDRAWEFAKLFGSYVAEVMRHEFGGGWGIVRADGQDAYAFMFGASPTTIMPWQKVLKRIEAGPQDNVLHYYVSMTEDDRAAQNAS